MRVASIDIGTNSVLLLIAEDREGHLHPIHDEATITRLGRNVDANHQLDAGAVTATLDCLKRYASLIAEHDVQHVDIVATSAMRDAENGESFLEQAEQVIGRRPQIISGELEALLTCDGALSGLDPEGRIAIFDVGGGSTEIIVCTRIGKGSATLRNAVSLDIGSVRLTERHLHHDPPTPTEIAALRTTVRQELKKSPKIQGLPLIGVAGTVTTLASFIHDIAPYDGRLVHGALLSHEALIDALHELAGMPLEQRRQLATVDAGRADVIVAGSIIVDEICEAAQASRIIVSDRGVRWGLAQRLIRDESPT